MDRLIKNEGWFAHPYFKKIAKAIAKFEYPHLRPEKPRGGTFPPSKLYVTQDIYKEIEASILSSEREAVWWDGVRTPPYKYLIFDNVTPGYYELEVIIQDKHKMLLENGYKHIEGDLKYDCLEERWLEDVTFAD